MKAEIENMIMHNIAGEIVACFYILPDGNLHPDSWIGRNWYDLMQEIGVK